MACRSVDFPRTDVLNSVITASVQNLTSCAHILRELNLIGRALTLYARTAPGLRPEGVGFSYCDYDGCTANDTSTAVDNHGVLKEFFKGFPEFASNEFFISGESCEFEAQWRAMYNNSRAQLDFLTIDADVHIPQLLS